jgi:predicted DNA-binding protein
LARIPISIRVDADLIERLRNAVWHLGRGLTITAVIEEAVTKAVEELETHNHGKPFPPRSSKLPKSPPPRG